MSNHKKKETMDYQSWKKANRQNYITKDAFQKHKKEYNFNILEDHPSVSSKLVSGQCLTPNCKGIYEKKFNRFQNTGPFCRKCINVVFLKENKRQLIKDYYPEVMENIISDICLDNITVNSRIKVISKCIEKCSKCKKEHTWETTIQGLVDAYKRGSNGCHICCGIRCKCMTDDEFRCYSCKRVLNNTDRSYTNNIKRNICKLCNSKRYDGKMEGYMTQLWSSTKTFMKNDPSKAGDMDRPYIDKMFNEQKGLCFISGVKMNAGYHASWKISIERIHSDGGYNKNNVVLIAAEFQNSKRQWNQVNWDELCCIVQGTLQFEIPDEEKIIYEHVMKAVQKTKIKSAGRRFALMKNENEEIQCKYCNEWLDIDDNFQKDNLTCCKKCIKARKLKYSNTLKGRLLKLLSDSKKRINELKGGAKEHNLTFDDLVELYFLQNGRCAYSLAPLAFSGQYQMSLERLDVKKGYILGNIAFIIVGLNGSDKSIKKHDDDDRVGFCGWSREKLLDAVKQNPRPITPKISYVKDVYDAIGS